MPSSDAPTSQSAEASLPSKSWRSSSLFIIGLLWLIIYFAGIFTPALLDDVDTMHAEAAREMILRHDWVTLYIDGVRYLEKPPLPYWAIAASYKVFGVHDWSTRLPLTFAVLGLLIAVYGLGAEAWGERAGLFSAVACATTVGPYIFTRFQIPDAMVALWLTLSFWFFLRALREEWPSRLSCWAFAVACALNTLTKGLIGLVFPFGAIGLYLLITRNLRFILRLRLLSSTLVFMLVAAPWHILAAIRTPDQGSVRGFLWFYFVNEQIYRFLNKRVPHDYDTVPLLLFWGLFLVWAVPWVAFLPQSLRGAWSGISRTRLQPRLLLVLWVLVIVGFFSLSTRQEYYTIPCIPAVALLVGHWLSSEENSAHVSPERRAGRISSLGLLIAGAAIFAAGFLLLIYSKTPAPGADLADMLKKNPQEYTLSFGHFLDLTPQSMGMFRLPLAGFSIAFLAGTLWNFIARRRGNVLQGNIALTLMMVAVLYCVHDGYARFSPILSSSALAGQIARRIGPDDQLVIDADFASASSLNFYLGRRVTVLHEPTATLWYGSLFPDAPRVWETQDSLRALWHGTHRIFLWADQSEPKELGGAERFLIAASGGKYIFSNRQDP